MTIKVPTRILAVLVLLAGAACHRKTADITPLQRKTAANYESEAQFAETMKDYARAGDLYAKASELCPDNPEYWLHLGASRRHQDQRAAARRAYESALDAYREVYDLDRRDPQALLEQVYVLALLGRVDDARATLAKVRAAHGNAPAVRGFTDQSFAQMLADPAFQALAL